MKTDPKLTGGVNVWWIKFFLKAVYATMHMRDHQPPAFHAAPGVDPDWYGHEVFTKTSEISKQVFPITLDIEHPRWTAGLKRLQRANADLARAKAGTGPGAFVRRPSAQARAAAAFAGLYLIPARRHTVPDSPRLEPAH